MDSSNLKEDKDALDALETEAREFDKVKHRSTRHETQAKKKMVDANKLIYRMLRLIAF